jgi:hypothetical protein
LNLQELDVTDAREASPADVAAGAAEGQSSSPNGADTVSSGSSVSVTTTPTGFSDSDTVEIEAPRAFIDTAAVNVGSRSAEENLSAPPVPDISSACSPKTAARMHALMMTDLLEGRKLEYDSDVGLLHLFERAGGRVDASMVRTALASQPGGVDGSGASGADSVTGVANTALAQSPAVREVRRCDWLVHGGPRDCAAKRVHVSLRQLRDHFFAFADTEDGTAYTYATFGRVFLERYVASGSPLVVRIFELLDVDRRYC